MGVYMFTASLEKRFVECDVLDQSMLDSIEDFINTISGLEVTDISGELKENIKQIAHEIILGYISFIDEKLSDFKLHQTDQANKLKLDRAKLVIFEKKLNAMSI